MEQMPAKPPSRRDRAGESEPEFTLQPKARAMRLVRKQDFVAQLEQALARILRKRLGRVDPRLEMGILLDVHHMVVEQVRAQGRRVRGMSKESFLAELERSQHRLIEARDRAREELDALNRQLARLRNAGVGSAELVDPLLAPAGRAELAARLRALYESSELAAELPPELAERVIAFTGRALRAELERASPAGESDIEKLQRRIDKLKGSLAQTEEALRKLALLKDVDPGVASEFRTVQGLSDLDAMFGQKNHLLRDIFEANCQLREAIARL